jgi:hypothetical protein
VGQGDVKFEPHLNELYLGLGRAYELNGQPEKALVLFNK